MLWNAGLASNTSPNMKKSSVPIDAASLEHRRRELLPELEVDVLGGVDPEAVDTEVDPRLVDVLHALLDLGPLREQVVEADEVAVLGRLAGECRVAAVVVVDRVVRARPGSWPSASAVVLKNGVYGKLLASIGGNGWLT